jgi:hypothetical protein
VYKNLYTHSNIYAIQNIIRNPGLDKPVMTERPVELILRRPVGFGHRCQPMLTIEGPREQSLVASKRVPIPCPASSLLVILAPRFPFDMGEVAHGPVLSDAKAA